MRVLFVSSAYPSEKAPQYCIFIEQQAKALIDLGHQVDVMIPCPIEEFDNGNELYQAKTYHGITVYTLPYKVRSIKELIILGDSRFKNNMKKLLQMNTYDIVSIHYLLIDKVLKMCLDVCNDSSIKSLVHFHGLNVWKDYYHPHPLLQKYCAVRKKRMLLKADCLVGVSNKVCKVIRDRIDTKPVYTVYNGVDTNKFHATKKGKSIDKFRIICVANLIPIKGHQYLVNACHQLYQEGINLELILIGEGSFAEKLKEMVNSFDAGHYIRLLGSIAYEQVVDEMDQSDVFVLPSFYEALGCVYLEAMAMQLPTVGIKDQGINEVIINGKNGFLAEPQSSYSLYQILRWIYSHNIEAKQIALKGYETVNQGYRWQHSAERLDNIYKELVPFVI